MTKRKAAQKATPVVEDEAATTMTRSKAAKKAILTTTAEQNTPTEDQVQTVDNVPNFKEDVNAFNIPIEDDKDHISSMPPELLNEVLSYFILDHDPERAVKKHATESERPFKVYEEHEHVLLSLSAMSKHFHTQVEDFSRRHMVKNKDVYRFKTNVEIEEVKMLRRSDRIKAKPVVDHRCYRRELTRHLELNCFGCNHFNMRRATMANAVACCRECDGWKVFPSQIV